MCARMSQRSRTYFALSRLGSLPARFAERFLATCIEEAQEDTSEEVDPEVAAIDAAGGVR
jgi:hypothetical protein